MSLVTEVDYLLFLLNVVGQHLREDREAHGNAIGLAQQELEDVREKERQSSQENAVLARTVHQSDQLLDELRLELEAQTSRAEKLAVDNAELQRQLRHALQERDVAREGASGGLDDRQLRARLEEDLCSARDQLADTRAQQDRMLEEHERVVCGLHTQVAQAEAAAAAAERARMDAIQMAADSRRRLPCLAADEACQERLRLRQLALRLSLLCWRCSALEARPLKNQPLPRPGGRGLLSDDMAPLSSRRARRAKEALGPSILPRPQNLRPRRDTEPNAFQRGSLVDELWSSGLSGPRDGMGVWKAQEETGGLGPRRAFIVKMRSALQEWQECDGDGGGAAGEEGLDVAAPSADAGAQ